MSKCFKILTEKVCIWFHMSFIFSPFDNPTFKFLGYYGTSEVLAENE